MYSRFFFIPLFALGLTPFASADFSFSFSDAVTPALSGNNSASIVDTATGITATFTATGGMLQVNSMGSTTPSTMGPVSLNGLGIGGSSLGAAIDAGETLTVTFDQDVDLNRLVLSSIPSSAGTLTINAGGAMSNVTLPGVPFFVANVISPFTPAQSLAAGAMLTFTTTAAFTINELEFSASTATMPGGASVPEPSAFALGLVAVTGVVIARRRKKVCA